MGTIVLGINDSQVSVRQGATILEAARQARIYVPGLCAHPAFKPLASWMPELACDLCVVEIAGREDLALSCLTPAEPGMQVFTETERVVAARRERLAQILVSHPHSCLNCERAEICKPTDICISQVSVNERCVACPKNNRCEFQRVAQYIGLGEDKIPFHPKGLPKPKQEPLFDRDYNYCVLCGRCVSVCQDVMGVGALRFVSEDGEYRVAPASGETMAEAGCKFCGACVEVCPTASLMDQGERWVPFEDRRAALVPCAHECPAEIDVPRYVRLIAEGRPEEALAVIQERVPFPAVLGCVCDHPCEDACRRGELNEAIAARPLKRFVAEYGETGSANQESASWPSGRKVAVVGSGPAGLAAAYYLGVSGYQVTLYEARDVLGGMLRLGIPHYRLPREILDREIEAILARSGATAQAGTAVKSLDALFEDGFEAVFLALGAHRDIPLRIEGEDLPGVMHCLEFLSAVNLGQAVAVGQRVAVIGGGNSAVDAARVARRLGASEVSILYRRDRAEMPAIREEVDAALEEGVTITFRVGPLRISRADGALALRCARMRLGRPDASGRKRPEPIPGRDFVAEYDTIIVAAGQAAVVPQRFGLALNQDGTIKVDPETLATSRQGVFAGGDAVLGPSSVVRAAAMGRKAAVAIDRFLGGANLSVASGGEASPQLWLGRDEGFAAWPRQHPVTLSVEERVKGFAPVEGCLGEAEAVAEARRCLRCDLRLSIPRAEWPPRAR